MRGYGGAHVLNRAVRQQLDPLPGGRVLSDLRPILGVWGRSTYWNDDPRPFVWHKAAEEIIEKVRRGRTTLQGL
jgi:hypothetical protein